MIDSANIKHALKVALIKSDLTDVLVGGDDELSSSLVGWKAEVPDLEGSILIRRDHTGILAIVHMEVGESVDPVADDQDNELTDIKNKPFVNVGNEKFRNLISCKTFIESAPLLNLKIVPISVVIDSIF